MAIEADVLVIGGGLAGCTAALAAARTGARVRLVTAKESTLQSASGLIDVLGYTTEGDLVADPFDAIATLPAGHPYERVGTEAIRTGLDLFDDVIDRYAGDHTDRNALVPTHGGTVKPTARYPESVAPGLASDARATLLVGFEGLTAFDAPLAAAHLTSAGVPFQTRGVTVPFPGEVRADATVARYAHLLDRDNGQDRERRGTRAALVETVRAHLEEEARVGFPAVLGEDRPAEVRTTLADGLGVDVFEVPMGPPSIPGRRLKTHLTAALDDAGVAVTAGNPVVTYEAANGSGADRIEHVIVDRNGARIPYRAHEYILATGGLVGKGIDSDREGVEEPLFGCHVPHPADRYEWFVDDTFGDHPFARFGVDVDQDLRPLDTRESVTFANLRAAGAVLGGADFASEKSGGGISLATGAHAGIRAGEST